MRSAHEWLKDQKKIYADGVEILRAKQPKDTPFFEKVKNPPAGSYHFRMLISKLENVARKELQNPTEVSETAVKKRIDINNLHRTSAKPDKPGNVKPEKTDGSLRITSNPTVEFKVLPEDLQVKYMRNKEVVRLMSQKQVELKAATTDQERKVLIEEISGLDLEKKANWKAIDEWWSKNKPAQKELTKEEKIAQAAIDKARRIETLKINISRDKKKLAKVAEEKKAKAVEKIEMWEKELRDLQKQ